MSGRVTTLSAMVLSAAVLTACTGGASTGSRESRVAAGKDAGGLAVSAPNADAPGASGGTSGKTSGAGTATAALHLAPQLILTGSLSVVVRSVVSAAARAESIAVDAGGRTDSDDQDSARGSRPVAMLTVRVPNPTVPSVLNRLAGLGRQTDRHLSTRDVTAEVADVGSRVASARASITSLRALYAKATRVSDIIRIESGLSEREASLESLEARQRSLGGQVALASITLDLTQRRLAAPPPVHRTTRGGFVGGLARGWHAFTAVVDGLAVGFGAALPFLAVLAVLAAIALALRRRTRPRAVPAADGE